MKYAISFIVGAVVGATVSYFITSRCERKKADEQIAAVTSKMKELKDEDGINIVPGFVKKENDIPVEVEAVANNEPTSPIVKVTEIDYNAISNAKKPVKKKENLREEILQVDEHKYYDYVNNKNYGESIFTFYQGDGVLVDEETGRRVFDPEKYVGPHGVDAMRKVSVEEVYYADEKDEIVNCITISEDSYYEDEPENDLE